MFAGLNNPFTGLRPLVHSGASAAGGVRQPATGRVRVRPIGRALYREYQYTVHPDDEHRAERLQQAIRDDLSHDDKRLIASAFTLHPAGSTSVQLNTNDKLDRQLKRDPRSQLTVVYRVQEGVQAAPPRTLPVYRTAEQRRAAQAAAAGVNLSSADPAQRARDELARLRADVCERVSSAIETLGARRDDAEVRRIAREQLRDKQPALQRLGARQPHALLNQLAFDVAAAALSTDQRLLQQKNVGVKEVYCASMLNSPVWPTLAERLQAERDADRAAVHPQPVVAPRAAPARIAADYSTSCPSFVVPIYTFVSGRTKAPAAMQAMQERLSVVPQPAKPTTSSTAPLSSSSFAVPDAGDALAAVGFRAHDSSAYRVGTERSGSSSSSASSAASVCAFASRKRDYEVLPLIGSDEQSAVGAHAESGSTAGWRMRTEGTAMLTVRNDYTLGPEPLQVWVDDRQVAAVPLRQNRTVELPAGAHKMVYKDAAGNKLFAESGAQKRVLEPWSYFISINDTVHNIRPLYGGWPLAVGGERGAEQPQAIGAFFGLFGDRKPRLEVRNDTGVAGLSVRVDDDEKITNLAAGETGRVCVPEGEHWVEFFSSAMLIDRPREPHMFHVNTVSRIAIGKKPRDARWQELALPWWRKPFVRASLPAGYSVSLQNPDEPDVETRLGAEFTEVAAGRKNVCVRRERDQRRVVLPQQLAVMPGQALSFELQQGEGDDPRRMTWRVQQLNPIDQELVERVGAALSKNTRRPLLILHENGSVVTGDAQARTEFLKPDGGEVAVRGDDGIEYFFDQDRALMFAGAELYGRVQAVHEHPTEPGITVVAVADEKH